jgi:DNA-binding Xre family transcriptional regulator
MARLLRVECPKNPNTTFPLLRFNWDICLDVATNIRYIVIIEQAFDMRKITTQGRITILTGKRQVATGKRLTLRRLAQIARVPKDLVYRLDAGTARYIDLRALARLCEALRCRVDDILVWEEEAIGDGPADESL